MPCYHPKKAFYLGVKDNGKLNLKYADYSVDHLELWKDGEWHKLYDDFVSKFAHDVRKDYIEIPCGHCLGCRLDYAKHWSERLLMELQTNPNAYFITITYDDFHLPITTYTSTLTGEVGLRVGTLVKKDFQDFIKRLRKNTGQKLRYFVAGEYGEKSLRPHYHLILYGLELNDLVAYSVNSRGDVLYNSETLQKAWLDQNGLSKGFIVVGKVTKESCEYTARYCMKKVNIDNSFYERRNMQPEFVLMSTKPGIGYDYYMKHKDCIENNVIYLSSLQGSVRCSVPRYFRKLYEKTNPDDAHHLNVRRRKLSSAQTQLRASSTSKSYLDMLATEEDIRQSRIKGLSRMEV